MPDLIFISMEDWDQVWRRNQFLCAGLARRYPGMKILFVGLAHDVSYELRHGRWPGGAGGTGGAAGREKGAWHPAGLPGITVIKPVKLLPNSVAAGRWINEGLMRRQVRAAAKAAGIRDPVLWLNPHYAVHMVGRMGERGVVYDVTDDWTTLSQGKRLARLIAAQDAELCRRADAVIVCSRRLFDMKRPLTKNLHLIPNGVHAEHYRDVLDGRGPTPAGAERWPKPVLGYVGTIHPDRVDADLVEAVANKMRGGSVVLVGPDLMPAAIRERFDRCGNIFRTGPVAYEDVPNYMRAFDVCIVPHRVSAFTESLQPIKLWEYLAAGKPIVSTDVAGFRDYPRLVRIARTPEEFLAAAKLAVEESATAEGRSIAGERQAVARENSWTRRVDEIERVISDAVARRGKRNKDELQLTCARSPGHTDLNHVG